MALLTAPDLHVGINLLATLSTSALSLMQLAAHGWRTAVANHFLLWSSCSLFMSGVLVVGGSLKLRSSQDLAATIVQLRLPLISDKRAARILSYVLPPAEIALGLSAAITSEAPYRAVAGTLALLMLAFSFVRARAVQLDMSCGCFSRRAEGRRSIPATVGQALVLVSAALVALLAGPDSGAHGPAAGQGLLAYFGALFLAFIFALLEGARGERVRKAIARYRANAVAVSRSRGRGVGDSRRAFLLDGTKIVMALSASLLLRGTMSSQVLANEGAATGAGGGDSLVPLTADEVSMLRTAAITDRAFLAMNQTRLRAGLTPTESGTAQIAPTGDILWAEAVGFTASRTASGAPDWARTFLSVPAGPQVGTITWAPQMASGQPLCVYNGPTEILYGDSSRVVVVQRDSSVNCNCGDPTQEACFQYAQGRSAGCALSCSGAPNLGGEPGCGSRCAQQYEHDVNMCSAAAAQALQCEKQCYTTIGYFSCNAPPSVPCPCTPAECGLDPCDTGWTYNVFGACTNGISHYSQWCQCACFNPLGHPPLPYGCYYPVAQNLPCGTCT